MFHRCAAAPRRLLAALLIVFAPVATMQDAHAHPHGWIDIQVTVLLDDEGAVLGLRQSWLFDEMYSAFATEGFDSDGDGMPDMDHVAALVEANLMQLREYDYFTEAASAGAPLAIPDATDAVANFAGGRLFMAFTLLFDEPVARAAQPFTYAVFDPFYMAAILHLPDGEGIRLEGGPAGCIARIDEAEPDPAVVAYALSLDVNQNTDDSLGSLFAERVTVSCADAP